jgi:hypothetical protein
LRERGSNLGKLRITENQFGELLNNADNNCWTELSQLGNEKARRWQEVSDIRDNLNVRRLSQGK